MLYLAAMSDVYDFIYLSSVCILIRKIQKEYALFEPGCRHVAKDIMGANKANPAAMILSSTMMLRHLGFVD